MEADCFLQECPPELAGSNDDYYSEMFSNTSKALLNRRKFWNETLVRKPTAMPARVEIYDGWNVKVQRYFITDYFLKGSNSEMITKVFVAEEMGAIPGPEEFSTLQGSLNDTLFFGILDMYNTQVFFFVIHPSDWWPTQGRFEVALAPYVRQTLPNIPPARAGSIVTDSLQFIPEKYIDESGYLRKI